MKTRIKLGLSLALAGIACQSRERVAADQNCSRGIAEACLTAASFEKNPNKADPYYRRACGSGSIDGCLKAIGDNASTVCRDEGTFLCSTAVDIYIRQKKTDQALELLGRFCKDGDQPACRRRDAMYWSLCRGGEAAACQALKTACSEGDAGTCRSLHHRAHLRCVAGETDVCAEARETARIPCTAGDEKSCQSLDNQLQAECRMGSTVSCSEHRIFMVEACSRGFSWACGTLADADRLGCRRLDVDACSRLDTSCRLGGADPSNCASVDDVLFGACNQAPAVCAILEQRCRALNAQNLCSAAISGYATGCRDGKGKREACDGLVDMCHRGNQDACDVAKLKRLN